MYGIGLFFVVAVLSILVRVYWVQARLPEKYLAALQVTSTEDEPLPARDGRILADSIVLASDVDVYGVEVHYRWLQEVSSILNGCDCGSVSDSAGTNAVMPQLVAQIEDQIHAERQSLRDASAEVTQIPTSQNSR